MLPVLQPGQLVIALAWVRPSVGSIVIIQHGGLEKIKRVTNRRGNRVFVAGDNPVLSTDSRTFGWLPRSAIVGTVVWPHGTVNDHHIRSS